MSGYSALYAVDRDLAAQYFKERVPAAIAYHPACRIPPATMTAPALILIGGQTNLTPAERCREMVAHARSEGAPITPTVHPGISHAFDVAQFPPGVRLLGHLCKFNARASRDAEQKLRAFRAAHLGRAPFGKSKTE